MGSCCTWRLRKDGVGLGCTEGSAHLPRGWHDPRDAEVDPPSPRGIDPEHARVVRRDSDDPPSANRPAAAVPFPPARRKGTHHVHLSPPGGINAEAGGRVVRHAPDAAVGPAYASIPFILQAGAEGGADELDTSRGHNHPQNTLGIGRDGIQVAVAAQRPAVPPPLVRVRGRQRAGPELSQHSIGTDAQDGRRTRRDTVDGPVACQHAAQPLVVSAPRPTGQARDGTVREVDAQHVTCVRRHAQQSVARGGRRTAQVLVRAAQHRAPQPHVAAIGRSGWLPLARGWLLIASLREHHVAATDRSLCLFATHHATTVHGRHCGQL
eukprot:scaffold25764_cov93-Isochrysis_galbana.AAC.2